jgi:glycogenin
MKVYITCVSTDNYIDGVLALNESLRRVKSAFPLVVLVSKGISDTGKHKIMQHGMEVIEATENILPSEAIAVNQTSNVSHWNFTFDKLLIFGLTQFEKLVFLDSDLLILENLDFLFDKPHMTATKADTVIKDWNWLNSGTMVIVPDVDILEGLKREAKTIHSKRKNAGDQDVVQEYYKDWNNHPELALPPKYNIFIYFLEEYTRKHGYNLKSNNTEKSIAIVHFAGKVKPWMRSNLNNIWYYATRLKMNSLRVTFMYLWLLLRVKLIK